MNHIRPIARVGALQIEYDLQARGRVCGNSTAGAVATGSCEVRKDERLSMSAETDVFWFLTVYCLAADIRQSEERLVRGHDEARVSDVPCLSFVPNLHLRQKLEPLHPRSADGAVLASTTLTHLATRTPFTYKTLGASYQAPYLGSQPSFFCSSTHIFVVVPTRPSHQKTTLVDPRRLGV